MADATLQGNGWYLTEEGIEQCKQAGEKDVKSIIKAALNTDLREIGKGWLPEEVNRNRADYVDGPGVLQLQKIRNVSAPKDNEDSQTAPRLMKLFLTDGNISCSAIETEVLKDIGLNTAPGSKIKLCLTTDVEHGFLLLNNKNTKYLGGRVDKMAEGWELKKKLASQTRQAMMSAEGGPPLFVPFGQRIDTSQFKAPTRRDNFKSLETKEVKKGEDDEFEQQRKATIAEALQAKEDSQAKKFGGSQKQVASDHDIAKITEMGFRADEASTALRMNNGNVQQALDYLLTKRPGSGGGRGGGGPNRQSSMDGRDNDRGRGRRDRYDEEGGGGRGRRGRDDEGEDSANSRPSGPATLFDFLETKFPESKGSKKGNKSANSESQPSSRSSSNMEQSTEKSRYTSSNPGNDRRGNNPNFSQSDRPKTSPAPISVPPRFVNKSKQDNYGNQKGQGYNRNDRSGYDDRPKSSQSDNRNYGDRSNNDRNYSDQGYNDRGRNYNDRKYNNQDNDRDAKRGRDTRGNRDGTDNRDARDNRGDNRGARGDTRGYRDNRQNYSRADEEYNSVNEVGSAKSSGVDKRPNRNDRGYNNQYRDDRGYSGNQNRDKDNRNGQSTSQNNDRSRGNGQSTSQNSDRSRDSESNSTDARRNRTDQSGGQNVQNSRSESNSYKTDSKIDKRSQQTGYRPDKSKGARNQGANGNYGNQPDGSYGNQEVPGHMGQYQQQQQPAEFMYPAEVPSVPFSLRRGDKVMAKYWEDGLFYESVVEMVAPNLPTCMVTFTEYGNMEEVLLSDIRPFVPQMMNQRTMLPQQPDVSVPPPQMFMAPPMSPRGMDEAIQGISSLEFRRGGGGATYNRKDTRPPQQLYQPPGQRR